ncbi:MAG: protease modulator HflC [Armatimonadetes bacterium]|nr:protease modulator HflC [Armatimonadota bacterium]MCX7968072.1 protease modulator HflC [Armatimonadota bacterium]MDW8143523.1 protease modulator HflC [Armatimonadota bacterium]
MDKAVKKTAILTFVGLFALLLFARCFFTVDETEWAVVVRFGKLVGTVGEAGLHLRSPIDSVRKFDKRLQVYNPPATEFLTGDKKNLLIDAFVVWQIDDPVRFWQSVGDAVGAEMRLHDLVWSQLAASLGNYDLANLVAVRNKEVGNGGETKLNELTETVRTQCRNVARRLYGIDIVDVRIKRLNFPEQNKEAVFARMRAERERIAKRYLAEGEEIAARIKSEADRERERILAEAYREAERIKGEGDAIAARIYGQAFSRDPQFYKMLRTLDAYKKALDNKTTIVLSADSEFLRLLTQGREKADR